MWNTRVSFAFEFGLAFKEKIKIIKLTLVLKCKIKQAGRRTDRQFERQIDKHT